MPVLAGDLFADYRNNEISADSKYKGKVLAVSGKLDQVGKDITGDPYLTLTEKSLHLSRFAIKSSHA